MFIMVASIVGMQTVMHSASASVCNGFPDCTDPHTTQGITGAHCDEDGVTKDQKTVTNVGTIYLRYSTLCRTVWGRSQGNVSSGTFFTRANNVNSESGFVSDTLGYPLVANGTWTWTFELNDKNLFGYTCGWTGFVWSCTGTF
jgi:Protein of unknown function (DUF2690)